MILTTLEKGKLNMKKICFLFLLTVFASTVFGQTTTNTIDVSSLNFGTTRQDIIGGGQFGTFSLNGTSINGDSFTRTASLQSGFNATFFQCNPCRKNTIFSGFTSGSWITAGGFQVPSEVAILNLQVRVPNWNLRQSPPKKSLLVKRIPVVLNGSITVRDSRNTNNIIEYVDNNVILNGTMTVEFTQLRPDTGLINHVIWKSVSISVSAPTN